jgi:hypothetical protein
MPRANTLEWIVHTPAELKTKRGMNVDLASYRQAFLNSPVILLPLEAGLMNDEYR